MQLTKAAAMPGYFRMAAEGDTWQVVGDRINQNDTIGVEHLVANLADMLDHAIVFADDPDMVDRILDAHGLKQDRE